MEDKLHQEKAEEVSDIVLYRYMPWDAFEKTISSWSLKATLASNTNDYFEFLPTQSKKSKTVNDLVKCARENVAFFCFSRLMSCGALWGNYADEFRGVCMAFHFPIDDKIQTLIHNIKYDCNRLSIGELGTEEEAIEKVRQLLTTKDISWKYEYESRLFYMVEEADEVHDGMFFYQEPMNYFCGVILGARCPYSLEYANILVKQSLEKHNICNHLSKNKDMIITKSIVHPRKFLITNNLWKDNMTGKKLRNKGYIFLSTTQIRKNTAMKKRTKSIVKNTYPDKNKSFSQEIFCALQTATLLEKRLNAKGTPYKVSDDDILPMQVLVRDMALEVVIKRMLHQKTYKCLDYNDKTIVLAFDVYTHKDLGPDKLIEEGIHIICRIIDPIKQKIN